MSVKPSTCNNAKTLKDDNSQDEIKSSSDTSFDPNAYETEESRKKTSSTTHTFWGKDPNVLLQYPAELFPSTHMSYIQNVNALTRLIIIVSIIAFIASKNIRIIIATILTLGAIYLLVEQKNKETSIMNIAKAHQENFEAAAQASPALDYLRQNNMLMKQTDVFEPVNENNPFGNVLMTDYDYNPNKKPAPPSYNEDVGSSIVNKTKDMVQSLHPDFPGMSDKLFSQSGDSYLLERSLRQFASNPSTTIPNDQTGFAEFLYGSMISCKEGNRFACARNLARHTN